LLSLGDSGKVSAGDWSGAMIPIKLLRGFF